MKKLIMLVLVVFFVSIVGAEPLQGFWGVPWGASIPEVEMSVQAKGYNVTFKNDSGMIFKNVTFANRRGDATFSFQDQKLVSGSFVFTPMKTLAYESYQSLKNDIKEKYGLPGTDKEQYMFPYTKDSGHKETAIAINYLIMNATWLFDEGNAISLGIKGNEKENRIEIAISYFTGPAYERFTKESKKTVLEDL